MKSRAIYPFAHKQFVIVDIHVIKALEAFALLQKNATYTNGHITLYTTKEYVPYNVIDW